MAILEGEALCVVSCYSELANGGLIVSDAGSILVRITASATSGETIPSARVYCRPSVVASAVGYLLRDLDDNAGSPGNVSQISVSVLIPDVEWGITGAGGISVGISGSASARIFRSDADKAFPDLDTNTKGTLTADRVIFNGLTPYNATDPDVVKDWSGNDNHAAYPAGITVGLPRLYDNNADGFSVDTDGTGHIEVNGIVGVNDAYSLEIVGQVDYRNGLAGCLFSTDPAAMYLMYTRSDGLPMLSIQGFSWITSPNLGIINLNVPAHIVLVVDGDTTSTAKVYWNGNYMGQATGVGFNSPGKLWSLTNGTLKASGIFSEAVFYDELLDAADVLALHNALKTSEQAFIDEVSTHVVDTWYRFQDGAVPGQDGQMRATLDGMLYSRVEGAWGYPGPLSDGDPDDPSLVFDASGTPILVRELL